MIKQRITSQMVADQAGVSRTTVSFVLNNVPGTNISPETRQRVLAVAEELSYVPNAAAQALAGQRTQIIGLVFPHNYAHLTSHAFFLQLMDGLLAVTREHNLRLLVDCVEDRHESKVYRDLVQAKRIDGLVVFDVRADDEGLSTLVETGFPVVRIGHTPNLTMASVDVDNKAAARSAVEHLLDLGHQRIGYISNAPFSYLSAVVRFKGYQAALAAADIDYDEALIRQGEYSMESGLKAMTDLLNANPWPTAVFAASDVVAFGALRAIRQQGLRVPDDIALVGFDDVPMAAYVDPPLTTIRSPARELGRQAGQYLVKLIQEPDMLEQPRQVTLGTELVVRGSTIKEMT